MCRAWVSSRLRAQTGEPGPNARSALAAHWRNQSALLSKQASRFELLEGAVSPGIPPGLQRSVDLLHGVEAEAVIYSRQAGRELWGRRLAGVLHMLRLCMHSLMRQLKQAQSSMASRLAVKSGDADWLASCTWLGSHRMHSRSSTNQRCVPAACLQPCAQRSASQHPSRTPSPKRSAKGSEPRFTGMRVC